MSAREGLIALAAITLLASAGVASDAPVRLRRAYADRFTRGAGSDIAERRCVACHSPMLITQQAKDSTAWEKTLGQMQTWGVELSRAERDSLRGYLLAHFGPRVRTSR